MFPFISFKFKIKETTIYQHWLTGTQGRLHSTDGEMFNNLKTQSKTHSGLRPRHFKITLPSLHLDFIPQLSPSCLFTILSIYILAISDFQRQELLKESIRKGRETFEQETRDYFRRKRERELRPEAFNEEYRKWHRGAEERRSIMLAERELIREHNERKINIVNDFNVSDATAAQGREFEEYFDE